MKFLTSKTTQSEAWPYIRSREERTALFRNELLGAAIGYAAKGYPVFPARMINGQKKPLVKWGKSEDGQGSTEGQVNHLAEFMARGAS